MIELETGLPSRQLEKRAARELHPRLLRERKTVNLMIAMYCRDHHQTEILCQECTELQKYAEIRLENCRFQENKPTCGNCPIHCYRKSKAKQIREVMRYSGPRMTLKHPILAIRHILDGRKTVEKPVR